MFQKQKLFYLNQKANNWTLISNSNYVENDCMPLPMLGIWLFWLMKNLTGILILTILFQNLWQVTQFYPNYDTGLERLRARWWACMQCACKEVFMCTKLCAGKSIKTPSSSTRMLFKVVSCSCVWKQIIFGKIRSDIHHLF